jgi:hypothetical protein
MTAAIRVVAKLVPVVLQKQAYLRGQRLGTTKVIGEDPEPFHPLVWFAHR